MHLTILTMRIAWSKGQGGAFGFFVGGHAARRIASQPSASRTLSLWLDKGGFFPELGWGWRVTQSHRSLMHRCIGMPQNRGFVLLASASTRQGMKQPRAKAVIVGLVTCIISLGCGDPGGREPVPNCETVVCAASDQCHDVGVCETSTGVCSNPPASDGTHCEDDSLPDQSGICRAGDCVAEIDGANSISALIGPNGGTLSLSGGPSVSIPLGAVDAPTTITISAVTLSPPKGALTRVFSFTPEGLVFSHPATVSFALSSKATAAVVYWTLGDGASEFEPLASVASKSSVSARISHFSHGFAGATPEPGCVATDANVFFCTAKLAQQPSCAKQCKGASNYLECVTSCFAVTAMIIHQCQATGCSSALALSCCDDQCVDTNEDLANCGGCGEWCGKGTAGATALFECIDSQCACTTECPSFKLLDERTCTCFCADNHCGPGQAQNSETCECETCPPGTIACAQLGCISCGPGAAPDPLTCSCTCIGLTCPAGQHQDPSSCACVTDAPVPCSDGACACAPVSCPPGQQQDPSTCTCGCNGKQVDTSSDPENCGKCGSSCAGGKCGNGKCCQGASPAELAVLPMPKPASDCPAVPDGFEPCNTATECHQIVSGMVCCRLANGTVNIGFLSADAPPCCN